MMIQFYPGLNKWIIGFLLIFIPINVLGWQHGLLVILTAAFIISYYQLLFNQKILKTLIDLPLSKISEIMRDKNSSYVKARGHISCEQPLRSPLTRKTCTFYKITGYKSFILAYFFGTNISIMNQREKILDKMEHTDFYVNDGSGSLKIELNGAHFDKETVSKKTQCLLMPLLEDRPDLAWELSRYDKPKGDLFSKPLEGSKKYLYEETCLPANKEILVTGFIQKPEMCFCKSNNNQDCYLISFSDNATLKETTQKKISRLRLAMKSCIICIFFMSIL